MIIDHGRVVLAGDLDELRAAVPERVVDVRYRGAPPDWSRMATAQVVQADDGHVRLRIDRKIDPATVITSLGHGSQIVSFIYEPPTLSELSERTVIAVTSLIVLPAALSGGGGTKHVGLTGSVPAGLPAGIEAQGKAVGITVHIQRPNVGLGASLVVASTPRRPG